MLDWGWIGDHLGAVLGRTMQHLGLATIALAIGFAISFGLAIWSVRHRVAYGPIMAASGILYTIPSLALFAALVPVTGLSLLTVEIPLVLYTLLILVRNIVAGLDAVPSDVLEAADGMGYTARDRLWQVELPLAMPLLIAGVRLASVSTIGLVTITATLGDNYGGLGFFILGGYHLQFPTEILVGAVPSILLAVAADVAFTRLQARVTPWAQPRAAETGQWN